MFWDFNELWQKVNIFAGRANEQSRDGALFPFWLTLSLEMLGRATLAKVHPVLLADPREGDNILYVFGYGLNASPKSIPALSVFTRCQKIVPEFTDKEYRFCKAMMDRRNEELHSGSPAFEEFPTSLWLAEYYRVCGILLTFMDKSMEDLFGAEDAEKARTMIREVQETHIATAMREVQQRKTEFQCLTDIARSEKRKQVSTARKRMIYAHITVCPACDSRAYLDGEAVKLLDTRIEDGEIIEERVILPTTLRCGACGLELQGHGLLHAAGRGGQYIDEDRYAPSEYYGVSDEPDPDRYFDYGND